MWRPDYDSLRQDATFSWRVGSTYLALLDVTGIDLKDVYMNPAAGIEVYRRGRPIVKDMFGPDVGQAGLGTPAISYGHINALGAELLFPDGGEVNYVEPFADLREGIGKLTEDIRFAEVGMAPFYLDYKKRMEKAFDGERCGFSYGYEGPMTTAYTLLGDRVFYCPYDDPELFKTFLDLLVRSIIAFAHFHSEVNGRTCPSPSGWSLCDDCASMFGPGMWPEFVVPYIDQYYRGLTTGRRSAHIEDLRPHHLHYLEDIGLASFDPSISARLSPKDIQEGCRVPFGWRLGSFHYWDMTCADIADWVFQAAADGAASVFTYVSATMCNEPTVEKVHAFIAAAKEAKDMIDGGASREDVGKLVSEAGRKRFWDHWPE